MLLWCELRPLWENVSHRDAQADGAIVQQDTDSNDDLSDMFFIKMVSTQQDDNTHKTNDCGQTVDAVKDDKWTMTFKIDRQRSQHKLDQ